jgi:hypothetical protein
MRCARLWTVIACSAAASGCGTAEPRREAATPPPPPLQEFDSNILKISWFRITPVMEAGQSSRGTKGKVLRGEAEYTVVFSYGWLRDRGFRAREKHFKGVGAMMMGWSPEGIPDETMRGFVGELLRLGLRRLPHAGAELTPELIQSLRALAENPLRYYEWQWARIVVVESDRGRIAIMPHLFRDRADLVEAYKSIDNYVSKIMTPLAPRIGMRVIESEEGDRE